MWPQLVVAALVLAGALALTVRPPVSAREVALRVAAWAAGTLAMAGIGTGVWTPLRAASEPPANRPIEVLTADYTGSRACRACHPHQYDTWHDSYHRSMTQVASTATARGPFDDTDLSIYGEAYRLGHDGAALWIDESVPGAAGAAGEPRQVRRPVVLITGSHHAQVYWLPTTHSRKLAMFQFAYRIAEQRWVPIDSIFLFPPDQRQLSVGPGRWNVHCIRCHATDGRPRLVGRREMDTEVSEFGIACEACHGGGAKHVRANRSPFRRIVLHLRGGADPTIVNPRRLDPNAQNRVCGQCHSIFAIPPDHLDDWSRHGFHYHPGDPLEPSHLLVPTAGSVWPDGVLRTGGREYAGLQRAPCTAHGDRARGIMTCLSCHDLHQASDDPRPRAVWADDQLRFDRLGDRACVGCHAKYAAEPARSAHTHHAPDSCVSLCMNCHMPNTSYGLLKLTRNHALDSPAVATEVATGRPNACNLCHLDRTLAWTADRLHEWTGAPVPTLSEEQRTVADAVLWILRGDANLRAITAWHMGWPPALAASGAAPGAEADSLDWMTPYLAEALVDPYSAVRFIAARSLRTRPALRDLAFDYVADALDRERARAVVRGAWREHERVPSDAAPLLLDGAGDLDEALFVRLLSERDLRPVALEE